MVVLIVVNIVDVIVVVNVVVVVDPGHLFVVIHVIVETYL